MRNTQAISVTIPIELAEQLNKLQKRKKKNYSSLVTDALSEYLLRERYEDKVREISDAAAKAGIFTEEDVVKAVQEVRRENKAKKNNR